MSPVLYFWASFPGVVLRFSFPGVVLQFPRCCTWYPRRASFPGDGLLGSFPGVVLQFPRCCTSVRRCCGSACALRRMSVSPRRGLEALGFRAMPCKDCGFDSRRGCSVLLKTQSPLLLQNKYGVRWSGFFFLRIREGGVSGFFGAVRVAGHWRGASAPPSVLVPGGSGFSRPPAHFSSV